MPREGRIATKTREVRILLTGSIILRVYSQHLRIKDKRRQDKGYTRIGITNNTNRDPIIHQILQL